MVHGAKLEILARPMAAELDAVTARLHALAQADPRRRDLGRGALRAGLMQVIAALDVYRTYSDAAGLAPAGRARIEAAVGEARRRSPALDPGVFDFLAAALTLDLARDRPADREDILAAAMRLQQLSGPAMAKGLEDTALYRYNRLIALNEVGSEPGRFGDRGRGVPRGERGAARARAARAARHLDPRHQARRGRPRPHRRADRPRPRAGARRSSSGTTSSHDPARPIDRNEEYFFYQLLLGAWPAAWRPEHPIPEADLAELAGRVEAAMLKSVREAGVNTRWVFGDAGYEAAISAFVARALHPTPENGFLSAFRAFEAWVARDGAANGLVQTALKLTVPGVPDIYQGAEVWEQSLVDPDNRRPIDFATLESLVGAEPPVALPSPDGAAKLALVARLLRLRRAKPALFASGSYEPLAVDGPAAGSICAFARRHGSELLVVAAALHPGSVGKDALAATRLSPPAGLSGSLASLLGQEPALVLARLFAALPVAVFHSA